MLETIYFTAPAWIANTAAAIIVYIRIIIYRRSSPLPLDLNFSVNGKRIFGNHRTIIGSLAIVAIAGLVGLLQGNALVGLYMGIATLVGTLVSSFLKRRLSIPVGGNFYVVDQLDYAISLIVFLYAMKLMPAFFDIPVFLVFILIYQLALNFIAFRLGIIQGFLKWRKSRVE